MARILFLAVGHLRHNRAMAILLALSFGIGLGLPLAVHTLSGRIRGLLLDRVKDTPLLIGARGSPFGLVFGSLYFKGSQPGRLTLGTIRPLKRFARGPFIPIVLGPKAGKIPLVGTTYAYFRWRGLEAARGTLPIRWGDAVAGARVARRLGLRPGSHLLTDGANPWALPGAMPLKLRITGVLRATGTADDEVLLAAAETVWIQSGLGHGHLGERFHEHGDGTAKLPKNIETFIEITKENIGCFHFHGRRAGFPVSAFVLARATAKEATLVKGVANNSRDLMAVFPSKVVGEILGWLFRVEAVMKTYSGLTTAAMAALFAMVALLLRALRRREFDALYRLGCTRLEITMVWLAGIAVVLLSSLVLGGLFERGVHGLFSYWWKGL